MTTAPFHQVRVLSFCQALAGNTCSKLLAELGADLVKVEARNRPDPGRQRRQADHPATYEPSGAETNAQLQASTLSTKGITLDMSRVEGRALAKRLVGAADVVMENFSATVMTRWGMDYESLRTVNPGIIMLSMPGLGKTGPKHQYVTYGGIISAFIGLTYLWEYPSTVHNDYIAAAHGAYAVAVALEHRTRTGEGLYIDLAHAEAGAALLGPAYIDYLANGREAQPTRNRVPGSAYSGVFRCKGDDAWLALELEDEADWPAFCTAIGQADLTQDPRFAAPAARWQNADALDTLTEAWTSRRLPHQAMLLLQHAGLAAGAVQNGEGLYRDPHLWARGAIAEVTHPDLGAIEYPESPLRLSITPGKVRGPLSRLGQYNDHVYRGWLGMSADEVQALEQDSVI
ncbi:MAG: CoA transferase [Chloroflexota bacterium]